MGDISGIKTKAACEAALMHECHVRIKNFEFVMHAFILVKAFVYRCQKEAWLPCYALWISASAYMHRSLAARMQSSSKSNSALWTGAVVSVPIPI